MKRFLLAALLMTSVASAADSPAVDTRLATVVEGAVKATGLSINISQATMYSVNINKINGKNVCDPTAASEVKRLQDALNDQPNIKENYGPAYYSLTSPDGTRKVLSPEQLKTQGTLKGCTNIYVSVPPK
jgi:hypothetical protein